MLSVTQYSVMRKQTVYDWATITRSLVAYNMVVRDLNSSALWRWPETFCISVDYIATKYIRN